VPTDVILVRHATAVPRTADGPDERTRPLTGNGRRQAQAIVETLSAVRPVAVYSSPYLRAVQTVEPTAAALHLPILARQDLKEWEDGLPYTEEWEPHYARNWADTAYARPSGESLDQVTARALRTIHGLADEHVGQVILAAGHGTFITRALAGFGISVDWAFAQRMDSPSLYRIRFTDSRPGDQPDIAKLEP
jgi:2,3-bisphosphoglycerate-dependent phosphoglycerate mutase